MYSMSARRPYVTADTASGPEFARPESAIIGRVEVAIVGGTGAAEKVQALGAPSLCISVLTLSLLANWQYRSVRLENRFGSAYPGAEPLARGGSRVRPQGKPVWVSNSTLWLCHTCGLRYVSPSGETRTSDRNASAAPRTRPGM